MKNKKYAIATLGLTTALTMTPLITEAKVVDTNKTGVKKEIEVGLEDKQTNLESERDEIAIGGGKLSGSKEKEKARIEEAKKHLVIKKENFEQKEEEVKELENKKLEISLEIENIEREYNREKKELD